VTPRSVIKAIKQTLTWFEANRVAVFAVSAEVEDGDKEEDK